MRVSFIEPIPSLTKYSTDMHMILPGMPSVDRDEYYEFFSRAEGHKILDNGEAEAWGQQSWSELFLTAAEMRVDEIVAPDVMGDASATMRRLVEFGDIGRANMDDFNFMGVAQGNSMAEIVACIQYMANQSWITVLGLPRIISNNVHKYMRCTIMESELGKHVIPDAFPNGVHCLGGARFAREAILLADIPSIRSLDTSYVASMSLAEQDIRFDDFQSRPANFWDAEYPDEELAERNHKVFLEWCNVGRD